ncbi:lipoprotein receptor [Sorangium sp. So ce296]|uniref:lipoprotein receptor n=1 Tax=Sorangium sp. So ce296 TaxID=3133296 RepID=UPI003F5FE1D4
MRHAFRVGLMLSVAVAIAPACTSLLGDFAVGEGGGASSSGGSSGGSSGCAAGLADCDGDGDCEMSVDADPLNCGACGAICLNGGTCRDGSCSGVTEIARGYPTPDDANGRHLFIYRDEVYWTAGESANGSVQKVPVNGGPVTLLADGQNTPYGIAVNEHGVFWANLNAKNIMWVDREGAEDPKEIFDSNFATLGVAADDREVFWSQRSAGIGMPGRGSLIGQITMPDGWPDDRFHEDERASPHLIALDEEFVYWVDRSARGTVNRTRRSNGQTDRLADNQSFPYAIAVDDAFVYWTNSPRGGNAGEAEAAVMRARKDRAGEPQALWRPADDDMAHPSPDCIAVDDAEDGFVYWTDQGTPRVLRKRKDGSGRQQVLHEGGSPRGIALHGGFVFWVEEQGSGGVRKRPL